MSSRSKDKSEYVSRLNPALDQILKSPAFRSHFTSFLSRRESSGMVRLWLDLESSIKNEIAVKPNELYDLAKNFGCATLFESTDFAKGLNHCQSIAYKALKSQHSQFLDSSQFAQLQLDIIDEIMGRSELTSHDLEDFVFSDASLCYFREYIEQMSSTGDELAILNFYLGVASYIREYALATAMADAISLYQKYMCLEAVRPLGLPDPIRRQVEESIATESGEPGPHAFDPAIQFAQQSLLLLLADFLKSNIFQEFVGELKRKTNPSMFSKDNVDCNDNKYSTARRSVSLRVARIDKVTGAYISEFEQPFFVERRNGASSDNARATVHRHHSGNSNKIKRIFSLRNSNSAIQQRFQVS